MSLKGWEDSQLSFLIDQLDDESQLLTAERFGAITQDPFMHPGEEIQLARILCELFEAIDHPKAHTLRTMVDALDKKSE